MKECPECGILYKGKPQQIHCSRKCRGIFVRRESRTSVNCSYCQTAFEKFKTKVNKSNYCSKECQREHYKNRFTGENNPNWKGLTSVIECSYCEKTFEYSDYKDVAVKYCSQGCKAEHQRTTLLGSNNPNYKRDKPDYVRFTERSYTGYKDWRMKVFRRDKFNCLKCGTNSTANNKLVAHHILNHYSHPELRISVSNGATFCSECHWEFHRLYGTMHNNQEQLNEYIMPKSEEVS